MVRNQKLQAVNYDYISNLLKWGKVSLVKPALYLLMGLEISLYTPYFRVHKVSLNILSPIM